MSEVTKEVEVIDKSGDITDKVVGSWNDMQRMAKAIAASALVPDHLKNKPTDVLVILQTAKELDIPPMQGVNGINVIKGKPSISPELQLALIRSRAPEAYIRIEANHEKEEVVCEMAPSKERRDEGFISVWNMKRAAQMGLAGNHNYKSQPLTMLKWRAVGEASRTVFPNITRGMYNTEEAFDLAGPGAEARPTLKEIFKAKGEVVEGGTTEVEPSESGLEIEQ
jgi:hypothetical protein